MISSRTTIARLGTIAFARRWIPRARSRGGAAPWSTLRDTSMRGVSSHALLGALQGRLSGPSSQRADGLHTLATAIPTGPGVRHFTRRTPLPSNRHGRAGPLRTKRDPLAFRLDLLGGRGGCLLRRPWRSNLRPGRLAGVLRMAASSPGGASPFAQPRARDLAGHFTFGSYAAHVVEVLRDARGRIRVDRIVCAIDCGLVVNLSGAEAQAQGGVLDGLNAALNGAITVERGHVRENNFHLYRMLRIDEAPSVDVHFIPSSEQPSGLGEAPLPPVAPALANAVFALTGRRMRALPLRFG